MQSDLEGRCALVTGAQQGIGRACTLALARAGADVAVNWLDDKSSAEAAAADIHALGRKVVLVQGTVATSSEAKRIVEEADAALGGLDTLINNAGIFPRSSFLELAEEQWDEVHNVNLKGSFEEYFVEKDSVNGFLNAHTVLESGSTVPKGALYDGYKEYCDAEMLEAVNKREFGSILKKKGLKDGSNGQTRLWKGLRYSATEAVPAFFSPSPAGRIQMERQKDVESAQSLLNPKA